MKQIKKVNETTGSLVFWLCKQQSKTTQSSAFLATFEYLHKTTENSIVLVIRITSNARDILNDV